MTNKNYYKLISQQQSDIVQKTLRIKNYLIYPLKNISLLVIINN